MGDKHATSEIDKETLDISARLKILYTSFTYHAHHHGGKVQPATRLILHGKVIIPLFIVYTKICSLHDYIPKTITLLFPLTCHLDHAAKIKDA